MRWRYRAATRLVLAGLVISLAVAGAAPAPPREIGMPSSSETFANPVYAANFPDPAAVRVGDTWYAYGTNGPGGNVPVLTSSDLVNWSEAGDALPRLGAWATPGYTWAPDVTQLGDRFLLYYTARSERTGRQCIGVAEAASPLGPFRDTAAAPLVCQADQGGAIDAAAFRDDDGARYLLWKNDGNAVGQPTRIYAQRLTADGAALVGSPWVLLTNHAAWHGPVVEAPQLVKRAGRYVLFYSGNRYDSTEYSVGYALCDSPLGPCRDAPENPILRGGGGAAGPGHSFLVEQPDGSTWLLYHAWRPDAVGAEPPGRALWLSRVDWVAGRPVIRGPTPH